jgi:fimbrial chaperone protein
MGRILLATLSIWLAMMGTASGGAFTISPIRIELTARAPVAAVTVRNNDAATPAVIQTQAMAWSQREGNDVYEESRALVVSPPIFTIAPGSEQVVRIALRGAPPAERESLYRIYFQELPGTVEDPATTERRPTLRMVLRMGVPVIVGPATGKVTAKPVLKIERTATGASRVIVRNEGTGHLRVTNLVVTNAKSGEDISKAGAFYVLPGQWWASDDFPVSDAGTDAGLRVTAATNAGDLDSTIKPDGR